VAEAAAPPWLILGSGQSADLTRSTADVASGSGEPVDKLPVFRERGRIASVNYLAFIQNVGIRLALRACGGRIAVFIPPQYVVNRDKRLVGIVSLVDIALANDPTGVVTSALCGVFSAAHRPRQRGAALFRARENAL